MESFHQFSQLGGLANQFLFLELLEIWHSHRLLLLVVLSAGAFLFRYGGWNKLGKKESSPSSLSQNKVDPGANFLGQVLHVAAERQKQPTNLGSDWLSSVQEHASPRITAPSRPSSKPRRIKGAKYVRQSGAIQSVSPVSEHPMKVKPLIFFSSITGGTEAYAKSLLEDLKKSSTLHSCSLVLEPQLHDLSYLDYDDYFMTPPKASISDRSTKYFYLILLPTYNIDTMLDNFLLHLKETHYDFRIDTAPLASLLGYSVFGFGDKEGWPTEREGFCSQARQVDKWMAKLTDRKRAFPLGMGDTKSDAEERLQEWRDGIEETLSAISLNGSLGEGVPGSGDAVESDEEDEEVEEEVEQDSAGFIPSTGKSRRKRAGDASKIDDLEDLGGKAPSQILSTGASPSLPMPVDFTTYGPSRTISTGNENLKPMVPQTSPTYASLTKQGYAIIGSHSGVKICRWTKSALRGRGSCYKRSFYGIASHLCMEMTPSLSCSNKCVFCWRHGTNPVGTTWRWQIDPPEMIFEQAKEEHLKKIKVLKGVPGVRAERFQEAMRIRHCALSLVGEPIFYPYINKLVSFLHKERISTFLVCNAQHPDQLAALKAVTQLYVSIDASNRDSLRKVDRPLHRDFWERFLRCLDILRERRHRMRTVFRLTLVKGFNIDDEVEGYADLVARGLPCFVEIKGVTFCGTSTSASMGLTMQNVPFYDEVVEFVEALNRALAKRGLEYGIAAEHAHSCCVLLASTRFLKEGKWHTLIDYGKFFDLLQAGEEFMPEDYMGEETPEWATWGKGGFDPSDVRVDRKGRPIES